MNEQGTNSFDDYPEQKRKFPLFLIISIILLLLLIGAGILFLMKNRENTELVKEKQELRIELQSELDSMMVEHQRIKDEYGAISDSLFVKDSIIEANAIEIKKLLDTEWEYYKIKKKMNKLRNIAQGYVKQIDSLYRVNTELKEENVAIKRDIVIEQKKNVELVKDVEVLEEKVIIASSIKAYNITAYGVRLKSGSTESITDKAKRVDQIKVCFTLSENELIPAGTKNIYVRIARPDKLILVKGKGGEYSFDHQGEQLQFSMMKQVDYQNQSEDLCLYWIHRSSYEDLMTGKYVITIFADGKQLGATFLSLR